VSTIDEWIERLYGETDFGRSVGTSLSGIIGLVMYLKSRGRVIAVFSSIIAFPIFRVIAAGLHERATRRCNRRIEREEAEHIYNRLSDDEKEVVFAFVRAGGSVLTWSKVNQLSLPGPAVESLMQRILWPGHGGWNDGNVCLDSAVFDVSRDRSHLRQLIGSSGGKELVPTASGN